MRVGTQPSPDGNPGHSTTQTCPHEEIASECVAVLKASASFNGQWVLDGLCIIISLGQLVTGGGHVVFVASTNCQFPTDLWSDCRPDSSMTNLRCCKALWN